MRDLGRAFKVLPNPCVRSPTDANRRTDIHRSHIKYLTGLIIVTTSVILFSATPESIAPQRGVCWVAATEPVTLSDFDPLLRNHVNWISQTPFGWHRKPDAPEITTSADSRWWGESDEGVVRTAKIARQAGIKTLLKPHVWGRQWSGDISMDTEEKWALWFENYQRFILHYARLAEGAEIEAFCVGTELEGTTLSREREWRAIIDTVRQVYHGPLVFAANWSGEYEKIQFWDALDYIGIQVYFPVADRDSPEGLELLKNWERHVPRIEAVQSKFERPVIFTEVGYRSEVNAGIRPWEWERPKSGQRPSPKAYSKEGQVTQANCYNAFFEAFSGSKWLAGTYIWKWHPPSNLTRQRSPEPFTPQGKIAEGVLKEWYSRLERRD